MYNTVFIWEELCKLNIDAVKPVNCTAPQFATALVIFQSTACVCKSGRALSCKNTALAIFIGFLRDLYNGNATMYSAVLR